MNLRSASATALIGSLVLLLTAALGWVLLLGPTLARVGEQREAAEAAADRSALLALQLGRLQAKAGDLGDTERAERRLADLLLEDLGALRHENAGSLAERAGVSKATAARLFRRLGYAGYKAAQREARAEEEGAGEVRVEQKALKTGRQIWTVQVERTDEDVDVDDAFDD